jgi:tripartite-type tricarboxylate transporter receptor subunit TctC
MLKAAAASVLALASPVLAQSYPDRPLRLVVPFAAGGSTDVLGRLLAQSLSQRLGQAVVVDNRAGAGTNLGAAFAAQAAPDGLTLFMASSTQAINVTLYRSLPYDLERDFAAVAPVATSPSVLVVNPRVPARTLAELVALAKSRPGEMSPIAAPVPR